MALNERRCSRLLIALIHHREGDVSATNAAAAAALRRREAPLAAITGTAQMDRRAGGLADRLMDMRAD
ncbi:unnamed protein product [Lampetra fluviatilis]